jgi:hypothetical protein
VKQGLHVGGQVSTPPTGELLTEAVVESLRGNETAIRGPQAGHRLANGTKGVLHRSRSDGETIFGKAPIVVPLCKDLKVRDWVCDRRQ